MVELLEFQHLGRNDIYSIVKIEWWLLKYSDIQKVTHDLVYSQHLFQEEDGTTIRLPPFGKKSEKEKFLDLYEALDSISQFHKNENYFEQQMVLYCQIKRAPSDLKKWVAKNEKLGADNYACFLLDYLDYDEEEKVEHLSVFVPSLKEINIFVELQDFKHTINFLEIFNELYWVEEILKE
ncbi:MAG: hypothetical protein JJE07_12325 [Flavobacteriaceae bacterium]|nr:hypothetical protein [Flavobacteriaceae bacterium]